MKTYKKSFNTTKNVDLEQKPRKKKALGQHFLRKYSVVERMIGRVSITSKTSVVEIGCGDGFLTGAILQESHCKNLFVFEIDNEWADYVAERIHDKRLTIHRQNVLEADWRAVLSDHKPLVLLANLPYQITFPIMYKLLEHKDLFVEGVVMVQEEVAQKIVAKSGRGYNPSTLFLQYHFDFELLDKVRPESFSPPPKVNSRTLYFRPKFNLETIPSQDEFWNFLRVCFRQPRRNLANNLKSAHYDMKHLAPEILQKRAQQLSFAEFLEIWARLS